MEGHSHNFQLTIGRPNRFSRCPERVQVAERHREGQARVQYPPVDCGHVSGSPVQYLIRYPQGL